MKILHLICRNHSHPLDDTVQDPTECLWNSSDRVHSKYQVMINAISTQ